MFTVFECNKEHVAILYGAQPCPLCRSHKEIKTLHKLLRVIEEQLDEELSVHPPPWLASLTRKIEYALNEMEHDESL